MENKNLNESNIFDDFSNNSELKKDVKKFEKEKSKDIFFYISTISAFLSYINLFFFLIIVTIVSYVTVQNRADFNDSSWLDPFCNFILWDIPIPEWTTYCSSITFTKSYYEKSLNQIKLDLFKKTYPVVSEYLQKKSFKNNLDLGFIAIRSNNRMKPLEIIDEFDKLKNNYEIESMLPLKRIWEGSRPLDTSIENFDKSKLKIICDTISISKDYVVNVSCTANSTWWDESILWFSWKRQYDSIWNWMEEDKDAIKGSINTLLASFINYIEINSDKFSVDNMSYSYNIWDITWATELEIRFNLDLKYNEALQADTLNL